MTGQPGVIAQADAIPDGASAADLRQVTAIEAHCVRAWPPAVVERADDGWVLRATPGLPGRGRSNHALAPARMIDPSEYDRALERAGAFAARHAIECGLQVGPTDLHAPLLRELEERGWRLGEDVLVMVAGTQAAAGTQAGVGASFGSDAAGGETSPAGGHGVDLVVQERATPEWVACWSHCDGRSDVDQHVAHAFPRMAGIGNFAHDCDQRAVGISVELDGLVGLFCLAVDPARRRQGLGKALVRSMLARHSAPLTYLQVFSRNAAGVALYRSLGFREVYRYRHAVAPVGR